MTDSTDWNVQFQFSRILPDFGDWQARYDAASDAARARFGTPQIVSHGADPLQSSRIWPGQGKSDLVFVHGGYWRAGVAETHDHIATLAAAAGARFTNVDYRLMPNVALADVVADVEAALRHALANRQGGPMVVCGHSAGGHLAVTTLARIGAADVTAVPVSGIYDLHPIRRSFLLDETGMTQAEADAFSPALSGPLPPGRCDILVGGDETPEFRRQADALAARIGPRASRFDAPGHHHMSVVHDLGQPGTPLFQRVLGHLTA